jgi:hypothetical protein
MIARLAFKLRYYKQYMRPNRIPAILHLFSHIDLAQRIYRPVNTPPTFISRPEAVGAVFQLRY